MTDRQRDTIMPRLFKHAGNCALGIQSERLPVVAFVGRPGLHRRRIPVTARIERNDSKTIAQHDCKRSQSRRAKSIRVVHHDELALAAPIESGEFDTRLSARQADPLHAFQHRSTAGDRLIPIHLCARADHFPQLLDSITKNDATTSR